MNKFLLIVLTLVLTSSLFAQKPEKIKYKGYFNNIPAYQLKIDGYSTTYNIPEWAREIITKDTLDLQLKGFNTGSDLTIVFYCSEPQIKATVEEETNTVNNQKVTSYYSLVTATSENRLLILNKDGLPVEIITTEPDLTWANQKGFKKGNRADAAKELESAKKSSSEKVRKGYFKALTKAYQEELDNRYSHFQRLETMRVFSIKAKKFDYNDFNEATQTFVDATSSSDLNSESNIEKINAAINIWKEYENQYQPGKKTKVCDNNIDEIYFNLSMGYLARGQGEELKQYWKKCQAIKGNYTAEGYAQNYLPKMIENYNIYLVKKDEPFKPLDLSNPEQKYNNMILLKGFLNFYFTQKHGNLGVIADYFPSQPQYVNSVKTTKTYDEGTKETIKQTYAPYGKLTNMVYTVEGGMNDDKTRTYQFHYSKDVVTEVILNGNSRLFEISYENGDISQIQHLYSNNRKIVYKFSKTEPGKTEIKITMVDGDKSQESKRANWIKYDENYNVTGMYFSPFSTREIKYDSNGNIIELTASNLADNLVTAPFTITTDEKGNATKSETKGMIATSSFEYIF
nr:hypothetical protein [uncultured Carboxylicivirga sp.]